VTCDPPGRCAAPPVPGRRGERAVGRRFWDACSATHNKHSNGRMWTSNLRTLARSWLSMLCERRREMLGPIRCETEESRIYLPMPLAPRRDFAPALRPRFVPCPPQMPRPFSGPSARPGGACREVHKDRHSTAKMLKGGGCVLASPNFLVRAKPQLGRCGRRRCRHTAPTP
jgi:hypothetical protein